MINYEEAVEKICDRCGFSEKKNGGVFVTIWNWGCVSFRNGEGHSHKLDLCADCSEKLETLIQDAWGIRLIPEKYPWHK